MSICVAVYPSRYHCQKVIRSHSRTLNPIIIQCKCTDYCVLYTYVLHIYYIL